MQGMGGDLVLAVEGGVIRRGGLIDRVARGLYRRFITPSAISPAPSPEIPRASMTGALRQLKRLGFAPATVIDVGVASQTTELYQEFPDVPLLLIEPLIEFEPFLRKIASEYNGQYELAAAGEKRGTAILNVHPDKVGSSLLREVEGESVDGVPREVPVVTVDDLCAERGLHGPYLVKADVQGAELKVLAGAPRTLEQTEAVILETTLFGTMIGGPQVWDIMAWMKQADFVVYDIYGFNYRPLDGALCQTDMVFVKEGGKFRGQHAFATSEQRQAQWIQAEKSYRTERDTAGLRSNSVRVGRS
jgi:FkbM family methyltransferase